MLRLPRLPSNVPIVADEGRPTSSFSQYWQQLVQRIETAIGLIVDLTGIQEQFEKALADAKQATSDAQDAADAAQKAADDAKKQADANAKEAALANSYIDPDSVLSATTTTITVSAHTRRYADGTSVNVDAGTVAATAPNDTDYVFYSDSMRKGGTVAYQVSTDAPTQMGSIHVVGAVTIPATGSKNGGRGPQKPGYVQPDE